MIHGGNTMKKSTESGMAMIFALILVLVISIMAVSIMFLSQSETWGSMNYRMMTQARYGAEAGLNASANYLANIYVPPPSVTDPIAAYTLTTWPVQFGGQGVVLNSDGTASNYPVAAVPTAFTASAHGSVLSGNATVKYDSSATLLSMFQISVFDSPFPVAIQTWQITSTGSITGIRNSQVQVSAIMERQIGPTFNYAAFGVANTCGSLTFGGGAYTNSYDSANAVGGSVSTQAYAGDIGSNGNLNENGDPTTINGTFSTPRTGVGSCSSGNVDAWTDNGNATVTGCTSPGVCTAGGLVKLPQTVKYKTPTVLPPGVSDLNINGTTTLVPGSYGNITITGNGTLQLQPGVYNINSISEQSSASSIVILPNPITNLYGPVILNVTGNGNETPVQLTGNSIQNPSLIAADFQIVYAGTGTISLKGNTQAAGVIYAPLANVNLAGNSDWYGAMIGQTVTVQGGTGVHYDRELNKSAYTIGNWMLDSFTWQKF